MSTTIPTFTSEDPLVPYLTKLPEVSTETISPLLRFEDKVWENLTLSSFSFKLNLDCTFCKLCASVNGEPAKTGSPSSDLIDWDTYKVNQSIAFINSAPKISTMQNKERIKLLHESKINY